MDRRQTLWTSAVVNCSWGHAEYKGQGKQLKLNCLQIETKLKSNSFINSFFV